MAFREPGRGRARERWGCAVGARANANLLGSRLDGGIARAAVRPPSYGSGGVGGTARGLIVQFRSPDLYAQIVHDDATQDEADAASSAHSPTADVRDRRL